MIFQRSDSLEVNSYCSFRNLEKKYVLPNGTWSRGMWNKAVVWFPLTECRSPCRWPVFVLCHLLKKVTCRYFICVCACVYMCVPSEVRKRVSNALKLELQATVNCPTWVMGTELRSSGWAASALNQWAVSQPKHSAFKSCDVQWESRSEDYSQRQLYWDTPSLSGLMSTMLLTKETPAQVILVMWSQQRPRPEDGHQETWAQP